MLRSFAAYQFNGAIGGQAANYRRTGAWCKSRIQAVDIKGQVNRHITHNLFHLGDNVIHAAIVHLAGVQHGKAVVFIKLGTNTNLLE